MLSRPLGDSRADMSRIPCAVYSMTTTDRPLKETSRKEGNVLFSDALDTFYLRLYGVRHMVKDLSDCEKGNPLPPHRVELMTTIIINQKK